MNPKLQATCMKQHSNSMVVHSIIIDLPYHQLKHNPTIFKLLESNKCFLQCHMWKKEDWNIVTIMFSKWN